MPQSDGRRPVLAAGHRAPLKAQVGGARQCYPGEQEGRTLIESLQLEGGVSSLCQISLFFPFKASAPSRHCHYAMTKRVYELYYASC
jgi:hypothetical protein